MKTAQIDILGRPYLVKAVPTRAPELFTTTYNYGIHNYSTSTILVDEQLQEPLMLETIRHEITHAVFDLCCLNKEDYSEEDICEIIGVHGATIVRLAEEAYEELKAK